MPELRKDPITGRWVIIATDRGRRPSDFVAEPQPIAAKFCPFCEGNEDKTPPEITAHRAAGLGPNGPGWRIRVVPNKYPALMIEGGLDKRGDGIYDQMNGVGAHEVIIETPSHVVSLTSLSEDQVHEVIRTYRDRLLDLRGDQRFRYGLVFKNVGQAAGASLEHTHSQLIVTPTIPIAVLHEMEGARRFFEYRGRCIFCDIVVQEIREASRIVAENPHFIAFTPFASRFPFETWVVPRAHATTFEWIPEELSRAFARILREVLIRLEGCLRMPPYNYIIHSSPFGEDGTEHFHWHLEIIPRLTRVAGFEWGTGFYINPMRPEDAAGHLRSQPI
ncbi:MAG: galactose-1-phosphate uridylyltransferase [Planctomycetes bacterium]|nr:galactose-1-phosphate uridylyltransferase [Planctomycetota bacterium]